MAKRNYKAEREAVRAAFEDHAGGSEDARVFCPLCLERTGKEDHRGSLAVNRQSGFYKCWKCEVVGRLEGFEEWDYRPRDPIPSPPTAMSLPRGFEAVSEEFERSYVYQNQVRFLRHDRLLSWDTITAAGIGIAGGRVVVPVYGADNSTLMGWVGRSVPGTVPSYLDGSKYIYPKGFRRADLVYNSAALEVPPEVFELGPDAGSPVLVVEGVFDAIPHWPQAVACLGKPAGKHLEILAQSRRPIVVVLDADAWEVGKALADQLFLRGVHASWLRLPHGVDPGVVSTSSLRAVAKAAAQQPGCGFDVHK